MIGAGLGALELLGVAGKFASGLMAASARKGEFDQQIRETMMKRDLTLGVANARAAASGVLPGSASTDAYLASLTNEFNTRIAALKQAQGQTYGANILGSTFDALGGAAGTATLLGKLNNWSF